MIGAFRSRCLRLQDRPALSSDDVGAWHSLRTRMLLGTGMALLALLVVLGAMFYAGARDELVEIARKDVDGLARQTAGRLAAALESVQVSGQTLAAAAAGIGMEPFNLRALLDATLTGDSDIAGAMLIIAPDTQKAGDEGFVWYLRRDGGRIVEQSAQELGYDYRQMAWYTHTRKLGRAWWSEPYANSNTGGELFTTYNLPLRRPGDGADAEPVGMVSVDVPLRRLQAIVDALPHEEGVRPTLLSPEGRVVFGEEPAPALQLALRSQAPAPAPSRPAPPGAVQDLREIDLAHVGNDGTAYLSQVTAVGSSGWQFVLSVSERYVLSGLNRLALWLGAAALLGAALWWLLMRAIAMRLTRPIEDLTDSAGHFRRGEFDYPLRHVERNDEVGVMARAFDAARHSIQQQMQQIGQINAARERMQRDLEIARHIQQSMLPAARTFDRAGSHLEASAHLQPARTVGGDFYHFAEVQPGLLWFAIGDVSDKGVPAALFMARAVTVLEVAARRHTRPDAILQSAAQRLVEHNDACMFATVLCGLINVDSGDWWLASAGHEAPLLLEADGTVAPLALESGPALGLEAQPQFPVLAGRMQPGQTLLGYTDGVTEAVDAGGTPWGVARLMQAMHAGDDAAAQCLAVMSALTRFTGEVEAFDDITLLAIRLRHDTPATEGAR